MTPAATSAPHPLRQYLPVLGMILATILHVVYTAVADDVITALEALNICVALLGSILTYVVPRLPGLWWLKPAVAALTAGLLVFVNVFQNDGVVTTQTWVQAGIQILVGLGIVVATNSEVPETIVGELVDSEVVLTQAPTAGTAADVQVRVEGSHAAGDVVIVRDEPFPPSA